MKKLNFYALTILLLCLTVYGQAQKKTWTDTDLKPYNTDWYTNSSKSKTSDVGLRSGAVYTLNSAADLAGLASVVNAGTDSFEGDIIKLARNIDLSAYMWEPIGTSTNPFKGSFDGGGFTISGMKVDNKNVSNAYSGLFGRVGNNAGSVTEFKNIILDNGIVDGSSASSGALIGIINAEGKVIISGCRNRGVLVVGNGVTSIGFGPTVGGLIGNASSFSQEGISIISCSNDADVKINGTKSAGVRASLGGFIGAGVGKIFIRSSYNNGNLENVSRTCFTGGFIGQTWHGEEITIIDSYSNSDISSYSGPAGGLIGDFGGAGGACILHIERCYAAGSIKNDNGTSDAITGGLVGNIDYMGVNTKIKDCLALQQSLTGRVVHRIAGNIELTNYKEKLENNYAYIKNKTTGWTHIGANDLDGAEWSGLMMEGPINNWGTDVWIIYATGGDANKRLPELKGFGSGQPPVQNTITEFPYKVTFNSNGGTSVDYIYVVRGGTIQSAPEPPQKNGAVFDGWYRDSGLTQEWIFGNGSNATKVTADITLYAKWKSGTSWTDPGNYDDGWYKNNPTATTFELSSEAQVAALINIVNIQKESFEGQIIKLTKDIDLSSFTWEGIGRDGSPFSGSFDGNGHTISGIKIDNSSETLSNSGFFGYIRNVNVNVSIEIKNIILAGGEIYGGTWKGSNTGSLAGFVSGNVIFTGCHNTGVFVSGGGGSYTGGLVGYGYGDLSFISCSNNVNIEARAEDKYTYSTFLGGLIGYIRGSLVINVCYVNGAINAYSKECYTGGFIGEYFGDMDKAEISDSYCSSDIVSFSGPAGGFIGFINETSSTILIQRGYVTGSIKNTKGTKATVTGGIIGQLYNTNVNIIIKNCLVLLSSLTGDTIHRIIGLVSYLNGNTSFLENNYAHITTQQKGWTKIGANDFDGANWGGSMTAAPINNWGTGVWIIYNSGGDADKYLPQLPGFGNNQPLIQNPVSNPVSTFTVTFNSQGGTSVSSQTVVANSTLTEPTKPTRSGYIFDGWYTDNKYTTKWIFGSSGTKVTKDITLYAKWINEGEGGSWTDDGNYDTDWYSKNPGAKEFEISTAEDLAGLAQLVNSGADNFEDKTIILKNDIDLFGKSWIPIGYNKGFGGSFDGKGYIISNITISIYIESNTFFGLFGLIYNNTENTIRIENLTLEGGSVSSVQTGGLLVKERYTGALAGFVNSAKGAIEIVNCHNKGVSVSGGTGSYASYTGGLVGAGCFIMGYCSNSATVTGYSASETYNYYSYTGGLTGGSYSGSVVILYSNNSGNISGGKTQGNYPSHTGGLIGGSRSAYELAILDSYNTSTVTAYSGYIGGLVGYCMTDDKNLLHIYDCYVAGSITKTGSDTQSLIAGGIIGELLQPGSSIIENCLVAVSQLDGSTAHRIIGRVNDGSNKILKNNYGYVRNKQTGWTNVGASDLDGANWNGLMSSEPIKSWDREIWKVYSTGSDADKYMPQLLVFGSSQPLTPNPFGSASSTYTVAFASQGSIISSQTVSANSTLTEPATPVRAGYIFKGWYSDPGYMNKWVFGTSGNVVESDLTLYALWIKDGNVLVSIPPADGVDFEFGQYEGEIGSVVTIEIVILEEYNKSDVWLDVNGTEVKPISRKNFPYTILTFEIEIKAVDMLIIIRGVERNDGTGIQSPEEENMKIYAVPGSLYIETSESKDLFIYSMSGQLHSIHKVAEGTTTIPLPRGIYIIKAGSIVKKVAVTK